jgi:hypothetical protein
VVINHHQREIKQIHNLILRKIHPGEVGSYRTLDMMAAATNYRYPPRYLLSQLMGDFVNWLNSPAALSLHPLAYGQENKDDLSQLYDLVFDAAIASLVEVLRLLVTTSSSQEKGQTFYQEINDFLEYF